jgi:glycogen debranching enzyme
MPPKTHQGNRLVYLLPLTDYGAPDVPNEYIYLPAPTEPPYYLRFAIEGTSSICRQGSLWVNIPALGEQFERSRYREYKLRPDFNRTLHIDVPVTIAGAFSFYTTYSPLPEFSLEQIATPQPTRTPTYYIDVEPNLKLAGSRLPLDALSIFSTVSKFMGKYPEDWDKHLRGISARGYNMVHFTPLQQRGESNSPYSLYNQLEWDHELFPGGEDEVAKLIQTMEEDYELLGLTDVVFNHTANNSKWLEDHPEAGYNVETAPWLESALELDDALLEYSKSLESLGLPTDIKTGDDLAKIIDGVKQHVISKIKLWEFFACDVERDAAAILEAWKAGNNKVPSDGFDGSVGGGIDTVKSWSLYQKADFLKNKGMLNGLRIDGRYSRKVNPAVGAAIMTAIYGRPEDANADDVAQAAKNVLNELNLPFYREYDEDVAAILDQVKGRIQYMRLESNGPRLGPITEKNPLIETYFARLPLNDTTKKHNPKSLALAVNGWIWAADAMKDNAGPDWRPYLRRELIPWSDCVKLRYGKGPEDNPFLWEHMAEYVRVSAKYFTAFRIDNCHSTPIHVAQYMLDEARKVRSDLAVFAELFTNNEQTDFEFIKQLGLSALIREAMQSWSTQELSRIVHRHCGRPIGSFEIDVPKPVKKGLANGSAEINGLSTKEIVRHVRESPVHALFMDCTHDNEMPAQKRDARDTLPNAALVNMCACATGSVMGYDEVYPKLVEIVHETRLYHSINSEGEVQVGPGEGGIGGIKKLFNQIHTMMGKDGYDETFLHHEGELITLHRVHPDSRKGYFLIAHTAFPGSGNGNGGLSPVHLAGTKARLIGAWALEVDQSDEAKQHALDDKTHLVGLPARTKSIKGVKVEANNGDTTISIPDYFPPGSVALFETWLPSAEHASGLNNYLSSGAEEAFGELDLTDLNFVLYRCDAEERDSSAGQDGAYAIPDFGSLVYAGLQGWWSVLEPIVRENNLGHPLCSHLRQGQWALDFIVGRMERISQQAGYEKLHKPAMWLKERFDAVRGIPSFLLPRYFAYIIEVAYSAAWSRGLQLMSDSVQHGQSFVQSLAMVSVQQTGFVKSASLWPTKPVPSLAAGLPHFAVEWARCWGRDVFISLRGLFLCTGRFDEAKEHIKAFGSVVKHGLIPNLLSSGTAPRYNSRDSPWFFLQNIQDYAALAPDGAAILKEKVPRRFLPYDDTWFPHDDPRAYSKESTVEEIVQEIIQRHASGLSFREYNAGPALDMQMSDQGFQIDVNVDWETGIIFGGSQYNCGTWMDKMGESPRAGSKGVPGTPRDGAAVEITGLSYSALKWVASLHEQGKYAHDGVDTANGRMTFKDWASRIKANFERCYWVPIDPKEDVEENVDPAIINRRGIYKDLYRSGKPYEDYQLRPNFPIAMTVAPDLFTPERALIALKLADEVLRGPTGMATLDPADLNYRPYYNNSEDSDDFATSKGRNYHQGPEWLWPTGFFLRALLKFDLMRRKTTPEKLESFQQVTRRLAGCKAAIKESPWKGLTELTNKNGEYCADSVSPVFLSNKLLLM